MRREIRRISLGRRGCAALVGLLLVALLAPGPGRPLAAAAATLPPNDQVPGLTWPATRALPAFNAPASSLDVVDLYGCSCLDNLLLFNTMAGLVNRTQPRVYVEETVAPSPDEGKTTWLKTLAIPYNTYAQPAPWSPGATLPANDAYQLVGKYRSAIKGSIVYDPTQLDSINIATTLAGIDDAVVASLTVGLRLKLEFGIPILKSLVNLFTSPLQAYTWAFQNVWPYANHRLLVGLRPGGLYNPAVNPPLIPSGTLRDYAVATRAMVVWLDPQDPTQTALLKQYLAAVQAERPQYGLPAWTPYLGWFPVTGSTPWLGEWNGVEALSQYSFSTVPADAFNQMTVFAGTSRTAGPPPPPPVPTLANRIYVSVVFSDGDNTQMNQHRMRLMWDSGSRGKVPLGWTMSPLLADAAPAMLSYYDGTASPLDEIIAGDSGAGLAYPSSWPDSKFWIYATATQMYMNRAGMTSIAVSNKPDTDVPLDPVDAADYANIVNPAGIFDYPASNSRTSLTILNGTTPEVHGVNTCGAAALQSVINAAAAGWSGTSPRFVSIQASSWCDGPSDVVPVLQGLGPGFDVVTPHSFFELVRGAAGLPSY